MISNIIIGVLGIAAAWFWWRKRVWKRRQRRAERAFFEAMQDTERRFKDLAERFGRDIRPHIQKAMADTSQYISQGHPDEWADVIEETKES